VSPRVARLERHARVDSTQRVVAGWLAEGTPEICLAVADEQSAGRGRRGRAWLAPPGRALLLSAGFRPTGLSAAAGWQLAAVTSMAMLAAAADVLGPSADDLLLKWPNDIVVRHGDRLGKVAGVLAESVTQDDRLRSAVVGIGVNVDWPASLFPAHLAPSMSSLRELAGGRPVDREALLAAFGERLPAAYATWMEDGLDGPAWASRQVTTGCAVSVDLGDRTLHGLALGVDPASGGLILRPHDGEAEVTLAHGEVVRCRLGAVADAR
jgi:BirA family biotin operon repressor/biotin-[acetyl-CoA-carboxylase] ligase